MVSLFWLHLRTPATHSNATDLGKQQLELVVIRYLQVFTAEQRERRRVTATASERRFRRRAPAAPYRGWMTDKPQIGSQLSPVTYTHLMLIRACASFSPSPRKSRAVLEADRHRLFSLIRLLRRLSASLARGRSATRKRTLARPSSRVQQSRRHVHVRVGQRPTKLREHPRLRLEADDDCVIFVMTIPPVDQLRATPLKARARYHSRHFHR